MSYYFDQNPDTESNIETIKVKINDNIYVFKTDNSVFSKKGLDFGTRTLLENIKEVNGDVLDFGCGYGPIGIYLKSNYDCNVDMVDINNRALSLARINSSINNVNVNIFESDIYSNVSKKYDFIISNPPIRVGKKILYEILFDAIKYLKKGGQLWIVINKDQGAKTVLKDLGKLYETILVEKNKGFYVICAINN